MNQETVYWSVDRKVTIAGLCSVLTLAGAVLAVYVRMNDRVNSIEVAMTYQKGVNDQLRESQKENKNDTSAGFAEVKSSIKDLTQKVDRLLERK